MLFDRSLCQRKQTNMVALPEILNIFSKWGLEKYKVAHYKGEKGKFFLINCVLLPSGCRCANQPNFHHK